MKKRTLLLTTLALFLTSNAFAKVGRYTIRTVEALEVSPGGFPRSDATGINDNGLVIGNSNFKKSTHAIVVQNGATTPFEFNQVVAQPTYSLAKSINNLGNIAGSVEVRMKGEKLSGGFFTHDNQVEYLLPQANEEWISLVSINSSGSITGSVAKANGVQAFVATPNNNYVPQLLPLPDGSVTCRAKAITDLGTIFGECESVRREAYPVKWSHDHTPTKFAKPENADATRISGANFKTEMSVGSAVIDGQAIAMQWSREGVVKNLGCLDEDSSSEALAINQEGIAVGYSSDQSSDLFRAVAFSEGQIVDLNSRIDGANDFEELQFANAINSNGVIVGRGLLKNGSIRGFVLTPVR